MPDYLLEIGTEELPAEHVPDALERLKLLVSDELSRSCLDFASVSTQGTPRRLACLVKGLSTVQATTARKVKGPPVKSSFDVHGKPLAPALGFAQKHGALVEELVREEMGGEVYLAFNLVIEGQPAQTVLGQLMPKIIQQLSGERLMRWGTSDLKFSRPIRWLVSLLDTEEVGFVLDGLSAGRISRGHRTLSPGPVRIESPATYEEDLLRARVMVSPQMRQEVIERQVQELAHRISGRPLQLKSRLLTEVVHLTEWPRAVLGNFAPEYLDLPDTLIETLMVHHQRYFPVESTAQATAPRHKLLPCFISVANNDHEDAIPAIVRGNERVLRARLADGRFFYFDDQKVKLTERKAALGQLSFQEGLGSFLEKQERLVNACRQLSHHLKLESKLAICLERTAELCKLDLVTHLVRELPELQGYVGAWYAEAAGEPPEVVAAMASHYSPRQAEDQIPQDISGRLVSVVDKVDNLVALFCLGKRSTGSSDPYALRRQAQGVIDVLMDGLAEFPVDLTWLTQVLLAELKPRLEKGGRNTGQDLMDLRDFLCQRLKSKLLDKNFPREIVESVLSVGDSLSNLADVELRCSCLTELIASPLGLDLVRAAVRIGNILTRDSTMQFDESLFTEAAERELWSCFHHEVMLVWEEAGAFKEPKGRDEYHRLIGLLKKIAPLVDNLFARVMVNDPDERLRNNRHGMLLRIDRYFKSIADFPKLQPLLL